MASIRKEGKFYKIYFYADGKQYKKSLKTTSRKVAEQIKRKIEEEIVRGIFQIEDYTYRSQKSLSEFFDEVEAYSKANNKSDRTIERELGIFKNFKIYFSDILIRSITVKKIESYKAYLLNEKKFSPNGINIELRHLSAAFSVAVKFNYIKENPFKKVKKVRVPKKNPIFLTIEEAENLLNMTFNTTLFPSIMISLNTGARVSEICKLRWEDIDLENRIIQLDGKGSKDRTVPIPDVLCNYLSNLERKSDYVITSSRDRKTISNQFRDYADKIGLNKFTFHNLRDTYASWLVQRGVSLKVIQELLGHESIQTTMIYAHLSPDQRFEAVKVLDEKISPITNLLPLTK